MQLFLTMLEIFLQSIIDHPLAANSTCVHEFLLWPEALRTPVAARHAAFQLPAELIRVRIDAEKQWRAQWLRTTALAAAAAACDLHHT